MKQKEILLWLISLTALVLSLISLLAPKGLESQAAWKIPKAGGSCVNSTGQVGTYVPSSGPGSFAGVECRITTNQNEAQPAQ